MSVKLVEEPKTKVTADHVVSLNGDYSHLDDDTIELMMHWHAVATKVAEIKKLMEPYDRCRIDLGKALGRLMIIPDGELESPKLSIPGIGSISKKVRAGIKVLQWDKFQAWCPKNGWSEVIQKRTSQAPIESLEAEIMKGNVVLPPDIAIIEPYEKTTITKARIKK